MCLPGFSSCRIRCWPRICWVMSNAPTPTWRHWWRPCRQWLLDAMRPAQAGIRPGPGLDLILRPSIRARWGGVLFVLVALGHAVGQWLQGSLPLAAAILAATAIASVSLWRWLLPDKARSA